MEQTLERDGAYLVDGLRCEASERIPAAAFAEAGAVTEQAYAFRADWAPGFYLSRSLGLLFGGCALSSFPDFFALFIVRKSFAAKKRWLIYDRTELLAHELCHVARIALDGDRFEETHAYRIAASPFRRTMGGMFHAARDAYTLLGATFLLLAARILQVSVWPRIPMFPFWGLVAGTVAYFGGRHAGALAVYRRALRILALRFGEQAQAVIFRCTDAEITALAALEDAAALDDWLGLRFRSNLRWRVIRRRFFEASPDSGAEPGKKSTGVPAAAGGNTPSK